MGTAVFPSIAYPRPAASTARTRNAVISRAPETAPVTLNEFVSGEQKIQFKNSLVLYPIPDDSGQYFWVREKSLGLDVYAPTRAALVNEIKSELAFLWEEYALADDAGLTPDARALKQNLRRNRNFRRYVRSTQTLHVKQSLPRAGGTKRE